VLVRQSVYTVMGLSMLRIPAGAILIAAGLPMLGVGLVAGLDHCGESSCEMPAVDVSCCADPIPMQESDLDCDSGTFCSMSDGHAGVVFHRRRPLIGFEMPRCPGPTVTRSPGFQTALRRSHR